MERPSTLPVVLPSAARPPPTEGPAKWLQRAATTLLVVSTCGVLLGRSESQTPEAEPGEPETRGVVLTSQDRELLGVRTEPVRQADLQPAIEVPGTARFAPQYCTAVGVGAAGIVQSVKHVVGDVVAEGEVLAVIASTGNPIRAPRAGTITAQRISVGESVTSSAVAFELGDPEHLWVELAVDGRDLGGIRPGDPAELRAPGGSGEAIPARVAYVGDTVDRRTMTVPVRIDVNHPGQALRAGASIVASLRPSGRRIPSALVVPGSAIVHVDGSPVLLLLLPDGRVVPTPVELGETSGVEQRIVSGVSRDAIVVVRGATAVGQHLFR